MHANQKIYNELQTPPKTKRCNKWRVYPDNNRNYIVNKMSHTASICVEYYFGAAFEPTVVVRSAAAASIYAFQEEYFLADATSSISRK